MKFVDVRLDDIATLRKPHPCGGYEWRVVRVGADIGLRCLRCGRKILMPRSEFERRLKKLTKPPGQDAAPELLT